MTPYSLAFYIDVVTSGTVLGAGPADSPERVSEILGTDFSEISLSDNSMWRDYGLVEFFWIRESPDHPWKGTHFTLQVHRLRHRGSAIVGRAIHDRYGRFDRYLRFGKLERLSAKRGVVLEEVPDANAPNFTQHWQPASEVSVLAHRAHEDWRERARGDARLGGVHAIYSSVNAESVARNRERFGRQGTQ
ncbi:hypothetical protein AB0A77_11215 [Streptomyces varsoviensis]|uniref:hypothetical protein n=1 Tax=Streptomyces varsoviensis TaxID=67373 RepID=UPI0033FAE1B5